MLPVFRFSHFSLSHSPFFISLSISFHFKQTPLFFLSFSCSASADLTTSKSDQDLLKSCLLSGPSLALVLTGDSGYLKAIGKAVGPSELYGGSLSARAFSSNCIKALHAGDEDEPAVVATGSRIAAYRTMCRLFAPKEVEDFATLFKHDLPPEVVGCVLSSSRRLGVVLKRASRNAFDVVGMKMMIEGGGSVGLLLRRCNGTKKWTEVCGDGDYNDVDVIEEGKALDAWIGATFGSADANAKAEWSMKECLKMSAIIGDDEELHGSRGGSKSSYSIGRQEGGIDGFTGLEYDRVVVNLVETSCLVLTPELVRGGGLSKALDTLLKNGFGIVGIRVVNFSRNTARELLKIKGGKEKDWIAKLEGGGEGEVACAIAVESDNALVRLAKLLGEAAGGGGGGGGLGRRGGSGAENFVEESGEMGAIASESGKTAGAELCFCFGSLCGQAKIVQK